MSVVAHKQLQASRNDPIRRAVVYCTIFTYTVQFWSHVCGKEDSKKTSKIEILMSGFLDIVIGIAEITG